MFGYYDAPYWVYRRPRYYYPRRNFLDRYLAEVERALGDLFEEEEVAPVEEKEKEPEPAKAADAATKACDTEPKAAAPARKAPVAPRQSYFYRSRSTYNGHDYVEEHRERVSDADGEHTTLRRRLGDRWYETETHTDKDGKSTSKETWLNVPE